MSPDLKMSKGPSSAPSSSKDKVSKPDNINEVRDAGGAREAYQDAFGVEDAQESTGRVSEILSEAASENKPVAASAKGGAKRDNAAKTPMQIKATLLKNLPSEKVLKKQIRKEIETEINHLHKKAMSMMRSPAKVNYFELTNVLRKIRDLKGLLSSLFRASLDSLKTLWLRYVHGIM